MMRTEGSADPPTTRIYSQEGEDFKVAPLPVLGASYALGSQLRNFVDLSDTVANYLGTT